MFDSGVDTITSLLYLGSFAQFYHIDELQMILLKHEFPGRLVIPAYCIPL